MEYMDEFNLKPEVIVADIEETSDEVEDFSPNAILRQNSTIIDIPPAKRKKSKNEESNDDNLASILNKDDLQFYNDKKEEYIQFYPDLTDPFDLDCLHLMIMEQITQRNLLKKRKKSPAIDIDKPHSESVKRQLELQKTLSVRRTDRVKSKDTKKQTINIAQMSVQFTEKDKMDEFTRRLEQMEEEEAALDPSKIME